MKFSVNDAILISTFFAVTLVANAQTEPYYKLPKDRTEKGSMTFPNLKPALTKFYLRGEGGFLLQGSKFSDNFEGSISPNTLTLINWGASLGFNYRDIWMTELGYSSTPLQLASILDIPPFAVPIAERYDLNGIALRYQRSVFVVDRIARTTRILIGGGIIINANGKAAEISSSSEAFLRRFGQNSADTVRITENTLLADTPLLGELSLELRGKVVEALEIGVYSKFTSNFSRSLRTNISYRINDAPILQTTQVLNPVAFRVGVSIHYNFGIITKYESNFK